jgi:ATP-dependent DNA helicase RecQ
LPHIHEILLEHWGYDRFRPMQEDIIKTVLDDKDSFALLPTGGGKSLCYQVPAMAREGICLVISPLIALMKDQVENLKKKGILAAALYSGMSRRQIVQTLKNVAHGPYKLLYVSPERIESFLFREYLPALNINLLAVDEAHCISQWGYDFRPSYLRIAALREELPGVPVLALTASATTEVQKDICEKLKLSDPQIFRQSFQRPNLSYSVFKAESKLSRLTEIVSKVAGTSIVYCKSRKRTVEIADLLKMHGIAAEHYHAGLQQEKRMQRQLDWIENKTRTIVCTNAFGMGIDKPDVRLVVHVDIPDCLESYYQEAGRAGRDGKKSYAVLLYNEQDLAELREADKKRYPSGEQIKLVYKSLVNFLQMPTYTGDEKSFDFNYADFVRKFKLDPYSTIYALKAIAQDGWFDLNDSAFSPSTIVFTASKKELEDFQQADKELEPLLTTLLRTYAGIFDVPVHISELVIAQLMHEDSDIIKAQLKKLHAFGIIDYLPQNDNPQIQFLKHRVPVDEFTINLKLLNERKQAFLDRIEKMIGYAGTRECRSLFINRYFGDPGKDACGICDNCLKNKATHLSKDEFKNIHEKIRITLSNRKISATDLVSELKGVRKEKAWQVINFLQGENSLIADQKGLLSLKTGQKN